MAYKRGLGDTDARSKENRLRSSRGIDSDEYAHSVLARREAGAAELFLSKATSQFQYVYVVGVAPIRFRHRATILEKRSAGGKFFVDFTGLQEDFEHTGAIATSGVGLATVLLRLAEVDV